MEGFRTRSTEVTIATKLLVGLIVLVRLSVFLLHTHVQAELDDYAHSGSVVNQDIHCLACDLESTAAVEVAPVVILPSQFFATIDRTLFSEASNPFVTRDAASSRGPPYQTI